MSKDKKTDAAEEKQNGDAKRILLVDDDAEIVEAMRVALESKGYQILVARDGNEGLEMAKRENPDLIILDMMMPGRSGFLVLERLRLTQRRPSLVIVITAVDGELHRKQFKKLGAHLYLTKPFDMGRLIREVNDLLS